MTRVFAVLRTALPAALTVLLGVAAPASAQVTPEQLTGMKPRMIGPAGMSGRTTSIAVDPRNHDRIFVGAASGGVWLAEDGGVVWKPVFDEQPVQAIGHVSVSRANPDLVWVGTGEDHPRQSVSIGNGVYRSLDGGKTWTHVGLPQSERISKVWGHPTDPNVAYVGAMGALWGPGAERGLYKTTDMGQTWQRLLYVDSTTGAADVAMDPRNPAKLFVAMYEHRRTAYDFKSGGPGSGLYVTQDGGATFTKITEANGMPQGPWGRIAIAISPSNPNVVYALVEAKPSALIRSDDGGVTWRVVNNQPGVHPRPMYFSEFIVDPNDENRLYRCGVELDVSEDGGRTWQTLVPTDIIHGDIHYVWVDPNDTDHIIQANDGGIGISYSRGGTWRFVENLPLAQFYQLTVDIAVPFNVYGGVQDSGNYYGPSTVFDARGIANAHWRRVGGGDGMATMVDFSNPRFLYVSSQDGNLRRFDKVTGEVRSVRSRAPAGTRTRFNWNTPLAVDAVDSATIYHGSQVLSRSRDGGRTWEIISPDLTTNNAGRQSPPAFLVGGELDANTTILSISTSPLQAGVIYAGTDDGNLQVTRDGGRTWTNTGDRLPGAPDSAYIPSVKASFHVPGRAYAVVDGHRDGDLNAYVYKTEAFGERWERLPIPVEMGFLHEVAEDPVQPNLLFAGGELGLFVSLDRGTSWMKWATGYSADGKLPAAPVRAIVVHPRDHDLVIGTHGRAVYIIDDVRPLRELAGDPAVRTRALHFFTPGTVQQHEVAMLGDAGIHLGYRIIGHAMFFGESRPYGAILTYWSADAGDPAEVEIRNAAGRVIRHMTGAPTVAGINRFVWNLAEDAGPLAARGPGGGGSPALDDGVNQGPQQPEGPEVAPGRYTVTIRVGGQEATQTVEVVADPRKDVEFFNQAPSR